MTKPDGAMTAAASDAVVRTTIEELRVAFQRQDFETADRLLDVLREVWVDDRLGGDSDTGQADAGRRD